MTAVAARHVRRRPAAALRLRAPWRRRRGGRVVVLGAGGFGRSVLDVVDVVDALVATGARLRVVGFLDPDPAALPPTARPGGVVLGGDAHGGGAGTGS